MTHAIVIPMGQRSAIAPLTQSDKDAIAAIVLNPTTDGYLARIGQYVGSAFGLGGSSRNIRYNVEFNATNNSVVLALKIHGNCYVAGDNLALRYTGYANGGVMNFANEDDLTGFARVMGMGISPNGKPYIYFEANNRYAVFNIYTMRHIIGNDLQQDNISVVLTEAGVTWT